MTKKRRFLSRIRWCPNESYHLTTGFTLVPEKPHHEHKLPLWLRRIEIQQVDNTSGTLCFYLGSYGWSLSEEAKAVALRETTERLAKTWQTLGWSHRVLQLEVDSRGIGARIRFTPKDSFVEGAMTVGILFHQNFQIQNWGIFFLAFELTQKTQFWSRGSWWNYDTDLRRRLKRHLQSL